jgi:hypothetical protein
VRQRTIGLIDTDGVKAAVRFGNLGELLHRIEGTS